MWKKMMHSEAEWFTDKRNGKASINSIAIYKKFSSEIVKQLDNNLSVNEILSWLRNETIKAYRAKYSTNPEVGALNNAMGRWNEFIATSLFSEIVIDMNQNSDSRIAIFSLPNSKLQKEGANETSAQILSLFCQDEFSTGKTLEKITPFKDQIFMSSPDYMIAVFKNGRFSTSVSKFLQQQARDPNSLAIYDFLKGKLYIEELKAAVSLKTSNRPDRRYQPLFEAAMIKAIGYVLQQRWKYYMVASESTPADRTIFTKAIAPHGVALEQNIKLVDGTYPYTTKADLFALVETAVQ